MHHHASFADVLGCGSRWKAGTRRWPPRGALTIREAQGRPEEAARTRGGWESLLRRQAGPGAIGPNGRRSERRLRLYGAQGAPG